ncbi:unnamed protein product [Colletotrichum noveboracense]|uniref:Uncharacterized protein n=1 Tax=Colletotrichum noveboracense TaxID=2664923 RepID=A0A9W4RMD8_9PEZI|nr:unnamed protein product [Colletotrichum noveboracense]
MSGSADTKDIHKGCSSQTASPPEMRNLILEKLTVLRVQNDHLIQQNMIMIHQNQVMINNNMTVVETLKSMIRLGFIFLLMAHDPIADYLRGSPTTSTPDKLDTPVNDTEGKDKELPSKADNNH